MVADQLIQSWFILTVWIVPIMCFPLSIVLQKLYDCRKPKEHEPIALVDIPIQTTEAWESAYEQAHRHTD